MKRVTTPTHTFVFSENPNLWQGFRITYKQGDRIVLEKSDPSQIDITSDGSTYKLSCTLTQEETKKFAPNKKAQVQIRRKNKDGNVAASEIFIIEVGDVLNKEIL